ncbi:MAG TPA: cytidine deaminase [Aestuariivirgaceae bacterium]|jgi:cytidine deaminase
MMPNDLIDAALDARKHAYAPYSNFQVGAALRDETGRIHAGCNVENAAFPQGVCAEAAALSAMVLAGGLRCVEMAIVGGGDSLITPCGGCRQKLREFATDDMTIHACDETGVLKRTFMLGELLPFAFSPTHLGPSA